MNYIILFKKIYKFLIIMKLNFLKFLNLNLFKKEEIKILEYKEFKKY